MSVALLVPRTSPVRERNRGHDVLPRLGEGGWDLQARRSARSPPLQAEGRGEDDRGALAVLVEPDVDLGDRRIGIVRLDDERLSLVADPLVVTLTGAGRDGSVFPPHDR